MTSKYRQKHLSHCSMLCGPLHGPSLGVCDFEAFGGQQMEEEEWRVGSMQWVCSPPWQPGPIHCC